MCIIWVISHNIDPRLQVRNRKLAIRIPAGSTGCKGLFYNSCNMFVIVIGPGHMLNFILTNNLFFKSIRSGLKVVYSVNVHMWATATDGAASIAG